MDLTQAFNALGTTVGPKIGGLLILSAAPLAVEQQRKLAPQALQAYRVQEAASVKIPYALIGAALLLLAFIDRNFEAARNPNYVEPARRGGNDTIWKHPSLTLAAIAIFVYVGAEVPSEAFS